MKEPWTPSPAPITLPSPGLNIASAPDGYGYTWGFSCHSLPIDTQARRGGVSWTHLMVSLLQTLWMLLLCFSLGFHPKRGATLISDFLTLSFSVIQDIHVGLIPILFLFGKEFPYGLSSFNQRCTCLAWFPSAKVAGRIWGARNQFKVKNTNMS